MPARINARQDTETRARPGSPAFISVFELFTVGIGPSSSHTVGPMRAARSFAQALASDGQLAVTASVRIDLYGSLAATGRGHGTPTAIMLGLEGEQPEHIDPDAVEARVASIRRAERVVLLGRQPLRFREDEHLDFRPRERLPGHPNALRLRAYDTAGNELCSRTYYSVGGGFITQDGAPAEPHDRSGSPRAYPFENAAQLLDHCRHAALPISSIMLANELAVRSEAQVSAGLVAIWRAMQDCVRRGCTHDGVLPGGLAVPRRAAALRRALERDRDPHDPLRAMDWVELYALAVNEENAAGGRVVTAPTNGAAGIVPAVLHYYATFVPGADEQGVVRFLLTAGAIGTLYKRNASISGADVGCQGEVGSASSMAAAGLAEVLGGTAAQVETAAEIAMSTTSASPATPLRAWCRSPASNATPSRPSTRSPLRDSPSTATAATTFHSTRSSPRCARPAPT